MPTIMLGRKKQHRLLIDDEDYEAVRQLRLQVTERQYVKYCAPGDHRRTPRRYYLHHFILGNHPGKDIDHINGNRLDNRRENLRVASRHLNTVNYHRHNSRNTSGVRGVHWDAQREKWVVQLCVNYRRVKLGYFATIEEATIARQQGELKYFGQLCPVPPLRFEDWGGMGC